MKFCLIGLALLVQSTLSFAADSTVTNAKITKVEFWGSQFTVYLDKPHTALGCGHRFSFAMDSLAEQSKPYMSVLLTTWAAGKTVSVKVTDSVCSGDRPTLKNWSAQ